MEVLDHSPDYRELLEVLLAEECQIGSNRQQQLGDDGRHSVEMTRPSFAFPPIRDARNADPR